MEGVQQGSLLHTHELKLSLLHCPSLEKIQKDTECMMSHKGKGFFLFGPLKQLQMPAAVKI